MAFKDPYGAHRKAGIPLVGGAWRDQEIAGDDIAGMILKDCVLERVRLIGTSLWQTLFVDTRFEKCEFVDCRLFRTQWVNCDGSGFRVIGGEFSEAAFSECRFEELIVGRSGDRIVFGSCDLGRIAFIEDGLGQRGLSFSDCKFTEVAADNVRWESATGVAVDFAGWSLDGAVLDRCMFVEATARGLDLSKVRFASCNLYKGDFREARIRQAPGSIFAEANCADADFVEADLTGALFAKSEAPGARFIRAQLANAMFPDSSLVGADFSGAFAVQSVWSAADLTDANFERVDAYRSTFRNGVLSGTRVDGARFVEADLHGVEAPLSGADLRGARGTLDWRAEREKEARLPSEGTTAPRDFSN